MKIRPFLKILHTVFLACFVCCSHLFGAESEENNKIYVTIDGGSATKKSPISQAIAEKFNLMYLETGAMYRTVIDALLRENILPVPENETKVEEFLKSAKFEMYLEGRVVRFAMNNVYLSARDLRSEKINANVAEYTSIFKSISDFCIEHAQAIVKLKEFRDFDGVIAEGRTCGMYLFPNADLKFWFLATAEAKIDFRKNVENEIDNPIKRDSLDFSRKFYPMVKPEGAIEVWTSSRSIENNINLVAAFVEQKLDCKKHGK